MRHRLPSGDELCLWSAIALIPISAEQSLYVAPGVDDAFHRVSVLPMDLPLLLLATMTLPALIRSLRSRTAGPVLPWLVAVLLATAIAAVVNPSPLALQQTVRLLAITALAATLHEVLKSGDRRTTFVVLAVTGLLQSGLTVAQVVRGEVVGLTALGEHPPLLAFGPELAGKGSFTHPYLLAGFTMIAATGVAVAGPRVRLLPVLVAALAVPLGLTYSRMTVIGVVAVAAVLLWPRGLRARDTGPSATGLLTGAGLAALATIGGWLRRVSDTVSTGGGADTISTGRVHFVEEAFGLIGDHPWFGVGPGQYTTALSDKFPLAPPSAIFPVHNAPLLVTAEAGPLAGLAVVGLLIAAGRWAWRSGPRTVAVFFSFMPFVLLDTPTAHPQGMTMFGLWLGLTSGIGVWERSLRPST